MIADIAPQRSNGLSGMRELSTKDIRDAMAEALAATTGSKTDYDAADALGWSPGSVKTVRNRANTLTLELFCRAVKRTKGAFLAPLLARLGLRAVPIASVRTPDEDKMLQASRGLTALIEIAPGGFDDAELVSKLPEIEAATECWYELRARARAAAKVSA